MGVTIASFSFSFEKDLSHVYISIGILLALFVATWRTRYLFFVICLLSLFLGYTRYIIAYPSSSDHLIHFANQNHTVIGYIKSEPDIRTDGIRYIIKTEQGNVYLKSQLYPRYLYGDILEIDCKIRRPEPIEDFRYDMYLARYGVFVTCQQPHIEKIGEGSGLFLMRWTLQLKEIVAKKITLLWHEPQASFMAGLLYGYRGGLGRLNELFSRTGVTHIIAISGYNITLVSTILITICVHAKIPRKKAFYLVMFGIVVFLIFAGLSASVVRAGIMGIITLIGTRLGRRHQILNLLMLTALVMTLHNPFILMWDAGFQLSFLSTIGLVYVAPYVERASFFIPQVFGLRENVVGTMAAILTTLPLILYQFGRLSVVAPIVNILILWIIPYIMILGFFAVVLFSILPPIALVLAWLSWIGLEYIIAIVDFFASLSFAAVDYSVPLWMMILLYSSPFLLYLYKKKYA